LGSQISTHLSGVFQTFLSRQDTRRLTHKGIEFDCLYYNSQDMRLLREKHGSEIFVEVRLMDDDLGSIIVVSPEETQLIRVPAIDQKYAAGMTRWQHGVCKRYQRRLQDDEAVVLTLFEAKERIRALIRKDMGLIKRDSRKKQARFNESSVPQAPPPQQATASTAAQPAAPAASTNSGPGQPSVFQHPIGDIPDLPTRRVRAQ
jgi:putative transposase